MGIIYIMVYAMVNMRKVYLDFKDFVVRKRLIFFLYI